MFISDWYNYAHIFWLFMVNSTAVAFQKNLFEELQLYLEFGDRGRLNQWGIQALNTTNFFKLTQVIIICCQNVTVRHWITFWEDHRGLETETEQKEKINSQQKDCD